jgi:hypothetical protein
MNQVSQGESGDVSPDSYKKNNEVSQRVRPLTLMAWVLHGLYDFSLKEEFMAINDNLAIVPLLLALSEIVLVIILTVFMRKASKREECTEPLITE